MKPVEMISDSIIILRRHKSSIPVCIASMCLIGDYCNLVVPTSGIKFVSEPLRGTFCTKDKQESEKRRRNNCNTDWACEHIGQGTQLKHYISV